jgi:uncharacterized protein
MSRIYWDTMLFVYWLEEHPQHAAIVQRIFDRMEKRCDILCTSVFTVGEILIGPYKKGALDTARQIREFFRPPNVEVLPFTSETAERFAEIRGVHRVAPADAIHLATAAHSNIDLFLTNDRRLVPLVIPGIQFIASMDAALL